jgi:hypothetical protein
MTSAPEQAVCSCGATQGVATTVAADRRGVRSGDERAQADDAERGGARDAVHERPRLGHAGTAIRAAHF